MCPLCGGTGEGYPYQGDVCGCEAGRREAARRAAVRAEAQRRATETLFDRAGVPPEFRGLTIDSLEALGTEGKEKAVAAARFFVRDFERLLRPAPNETGVVLRAGLLLHGWYGVAKTGLATSAYSLLVARGIPGLWIEWRDFVTEVQRAYGTPEDGRLMDHAGSVPLMLLDDLGKTALLEKREGVPPEEWRSRPETPDRVDKLDALITARHRFRRPTLITTNLTLNQIAQQFDARIVERLGQLCYCVRMGGRNLRLKNT